MSKRFIEIDRRQPITLPGKLAGWLAGNDWAHFIGEGGEALDTRAIEAAYHGGGSAAYPPKMLLAWLCDGDATGMFSSRTIERATDELIPGLSITGGTHPDHDRIHPFRPRCWPPVEPLFVQRVRIAPDLGIWKRGAVRIDGTHIQAKASKPKAMRGRMPRSWKSRCGPPCSRGCSGQTRRQAWDRKKSTCQRS